MSFFPDLKTFLRIEIGDFTLNIAWYALLILAGAILAYYLSLRNAKKIGYGKELLEDYFFMMMPLVILGARIWYVIFEWSSYSSNLVSIFYIWEGGLAIHGGLITGIVFSYFYFRNRGVNLLRIGDCIMPNVLLAQAIGRWGNFMNQEAYGRIVSEKYFQNFPSFIKDQMYIDGAYRQPMFLYEGVGNLIGFIVITFLYKKYGRKKRGDLVYAYVVWYGVVRFFIEIFRTDALMAGGLKVAQMTSIVFVIVGLLGIFGVYNKLFKKFYPFKIEKPVVLFDADGTLIDTQKLIMDSFRFTFQKYKPEYELGEEELCSFMGPPLRATFEKYFADEMVDEVVETYREYNHSHHNDYVKAMPHAKELLTYLKEHGYEIAVVSNKFKSLVSLGLEISGIDSYFDVVIGGDEVEHPKPDPEGLLKACELLKVPHDELIYVGDSEVDVKSAKNLGAFSIAFVSDPKRERSLKETKPCRIVYDLEEIISILKEDQEWSELVI
ncbi:phosphatidylglycerol:prolipoprotein diacylglycerol transferase [Breznakia sp. PF5-3]|uniref:prolipoprotein diacylglyceryl transferase n=1 Tax=unclassified Breznakia TaxID=2623764 RepID=UPI0024053D0F|nr:MULTISPECIES: prolipoprotein diacylglyceryl transferase [unclassified Breznakia]MDF9825212.1 phosphatidylglycerol:prolipoprotein diacylglycerol transferase [Breznakia sp. PM6-1]MDF9836093.1 phosphatidylglycerol:prolipoprotein diacylglycerol transferase [Breznakia sp. PF5-3]MDF9838659.1 phosphatidylglycerol:prolipoprotein diacylglycerol transferase [Breznakia sp. PFB2-8]MDF9860690.1 phosphatidylglycerol:prolipoprotein diacylglycerol transferase [Breznakia sp. PH5-24]